MMPLAWPPTPDMLLALLPAALTLTGGLVLAWALGSMTRRWLWKRTGPRRAIQIGRWISSGCVALTLVALVPALGVDLSGIPAIFGVRLIQTLVLVVIGIPGCYLLSSWIRRFMLRRFTAQQAMIGGKLVLYGGVTLIVITVLTQLDFDLAPLLGAAGILGIAIGFASQTSMSNVISGIFLMAEQPFVVGDVVTIGGMTGQVLTIDLLSVRIRTFDNRMVRIPNETIVKSELTNITHFPIRRIELTIGIAYKEEIGRVRELLLDIARHHPLCLAEPEPLVIMQGFGSSSIDLLFAFWVEREQYLALKNALCEEIKIQFDAEGIEIAFPHLSLYAGSATEPFPVRVVREDATVNAAAGNGEGPPR